MSEQDPLTQLIEEFVDELRDEPKCKACGVADRDHLGIEGTCRQLQEALGRAEHAEAYLRTAEKICERLEAEREKMLGVIEMLGGERFVSVDTVHEAILKAREIMAEIKKTESKT